MASTEKPIVFRVRGLPTESSKGSVVTLLTDVINKHLREEEQQNSKPSIKIAPSCYDSGLSSIALVEFQNGVPQFLSELVADPLAEWQMELEHGDITFDRHFFGFTQMYANPSETTITAE